MDTYTINTIIRLLIGAIQTVVFFFWVGYKKDIPGLIKFAGALFMAAVISMPHGGVIILAIYVLANLLVTIFSKKHLRWTLWLVIPSAIAAFFIGNFTL